jgi:2-polyprenyl-6-methoxyphenol hydroxylase-like FAD-dependent oxidoreductase
VNLLREEGRHDQAEALAQAGQRAAQIANNANHQAHEAEQRAANAATVQRSTIVHRRGHSPRPAFYDLTPERVPFLSRRPRRKPARVWFPVYSSYGALDAW